MNVSPEHRMIWWTKPCMGEKIVASCFFSHYFVNYGKKDTLPLTAKDNISFIQKIPQDFEDFSIILSIRNPYFQIINHYLDISHTNWKLKTNTIDHFKEKLNAWVQEIFSVKKETLLSIDSLVQFVLPFNLDNHTPSFVLHYEDLEKDLKNLPFIDQNLFYFNQNLMVDNTAFEMNTLDYKSAQLIYKIHKKTFEQFGYDPFSFTTQELSLKEKVDFIHS